MKNSPLWTADYGGPSGREWTIYDGSTIHHLSASDFLSIEKWCPPNARLVSEVAHLGIPRTEKSLAQAYTTTELQQFYGRAKKAGVELLLFSHAQTPKARAQAGFVYKSDEADVKAIHAFLRQEPSVLNSLQRPPRSFNVPKWRQAGWDYKDETNTILNIARSNEYQNHGDQCTAFVLDNLDYFAQKLSDDQKEIFGLLRRKKNGSFYAIGSANGPGLSKLYTLAALFMRPDGSLRVRPDTNRPPGLKWIIDTQLAQSPSHHKGGIARSNMTWHGFRNYAISKMGTRKAGPGGKVQSHYDFSPEQTKQFRQLRKDYLRAQRKMLKTMKELLA